MTNILLTITEGDDKFEVTSIDGSLYVDNSFEDTEDNYDKIRSQIIENLHEFNAFPMPPGIDIVSYLLKMAFENELN